MTGALLTADASVVVPALVSWHERHEEASEAVGDVARLPGHVLCETVSVLTRLPHGRAVSASVAVDLVSEAFPEPAIALNASGYAWLLGKLADHEVRGGAAYDALVGASAARAGAELLTLDERAAKTYRAVEVSVRQLA